MNIKKQDVARVLIEILCYIAAFWLARHYSVKPSLVAYFIAAIAAQLAARLICVFSGLPQR